MDVNSIALVCDTPKACYDNGGWFALSVFLVWRGLGLLQSQGVQAALAKWSAKAPWDAWPLWARFVASLAVSLLVSVVNGLLAQQSWWMALASGLVTFVMSGGLARHGSAVARIVKPDEPKAPPPPINRELGSIRTKLPPPIPPNV